MNKIIDLREKKNREYIGVQIKVKAIKDNKGEPVYDFAFIEKKVKYS